MGRTHRTENKAGYESVSDYKSHVLNHVRNFYEARYPGVEFAFTVTVKPSLGVINVVVSDPAGEFDTCVCGMRISDVMREAWELKKVCDTFCVFTEEIVDSLFTITGDWKQNERLLEGGYYYVEPVKFYDAASGNRLKVGMRLL